MKYLSKDPMVFGATKKYMDNYPNIDWSPNQEVEIEEGVVYNDDGTVTIDFELDDDTLKFVKEEAKKNNLTLNDAIVKMLEEGLEILKEKEEGAK